ncbi:hypothetical protein AOQ84DRAFT_435734 [Glonium stellatum]|uniref:Uncharacterized protein n=1 Tax=Glonium stellatum TaxID=574774 RepID=A0A8E2JYZ9_9PEZI|nr:hypothetical protein AOQ84DRAFT_435734 [Glonium stellatum]
MSAAVAALERGCRCVIDRASRGRGDWSDWPRAGFESRRELSGRRASDAMATARCEDATMRRKICRTGRSRHWPRESSGDRPPSLLGRGRGVGESLIPKVDDLQASTSSTPSTPSTHPSVGLGGESRATRRRISVGSPYATGVSSARPPGFVERRHDALSGGQTPAAHVCPALPRADSAAVEESPSPLLHATRPRSQGRGGPANSARPGVRSGRRRRRRRPQTALPPVACRFSSPLGDLFCDRIAGGCPQQRPVNLFSTAGMR